MRDTVNEFGLETLHNFKTEDNLFKIDYNSYLETCSWSGMF